MWWIPLAAVGGWLFSGLIGVGLAGSVREVYHGVRWKKTPLWLKVILGEFTFLWGIWIYCRGADE